MNFPRPHTDGELTAVFQQLSENAEQLGAYANNFRRAMRGSGTLTSAQASDMAKFLSKSIYGAIPINSQQYVPRDSQARDRLEVLMTDAYKNSRFRRTITKEVSPDLARRQTLSDIMHPRVWAELWEDLVRKLPPGDRSDTHVFFDINTLTDVSKRIVDGLTVRQRSAANAADLAKFVHTVYDLPLPDVFPANYQTPVMPTGHQATQLYSNWKPGNVAHPGRYDPAAANLVPAEYPRDSTQTQRMQARLSGTLLGLCPQCGPELQSHIPILPSGESPFVYIAGNGAPANQNLARYLGVPFQFDPETGTRTASLPFRDLAKKCLDIINKTGRKVLNPAGIRELNRLIQDNASGDDLKIFVDNENNYEANAKPNSKDMFRRALRLRGWARNPENVNRSLVILENQAAVHGEIAVFNHSMEKHGLTAALSGGRPYGSKPPCQGCVQTFMVMGLLDLYRAHYRGAEAQLQDANQPLSPGQQFFGGLFFPGDHSAWQALVNLCFNKGATAKMDVNKVDPNHMSFTYKRTPNAPVVNPAYHSRNQKNFAEVMANPHDRARFEEFMRNELQAFTNHCSLTRHENDVEMHAMEAGVPPSPPNSPYADPAELIPGGLQVQGKRRKFSY